MQTVRVWLNVPWLALAGAQLVVAIGAGSVHMEESRWLILRAVLLFGHAPHLIWLDMFAAMSNAIVIRT